MASADVKDFICSICQNHCRDLVNLKCGDIFCWTCIDELLNTQKEYGLYACPACNAEFQERPALQRKLQPSPESDQVETADCRKHCIHSTTCDDNFCAICGTSICEDNLTAERVLSKPRENRNCSIHKNVLEYRGTKDDACKNREHDGHQIEGLSLPIAPQKEKLEKALESVTMINVETDARVHSLQEHMNTVHEKAKNVSEEVTSVLSYTRAQLEDLEKEILKEITRQTEKVSHSVSGLIQQLEIEKSARVRKMGDIEGLYNMAYPVPVLEEQEVEHDSRLEYSKEEDSNLLRSVDNLDDGHIKLLLHLGLYNIMTLKSATEMQEPADILLDMDTAGPTVHVSGDRKTASRSQVRLQRPETPNRFPSCQVLSTTSFSSGCHYWEMETSYCTWMIGVCYPSMDRRGSESTIGRNKKSWSLVRWYNTNEYRATHDSQHVKIQLNAPCHRFAIYLDYDAGQLSFYALCNPIRHLHTFNATFTEPLHAAFWVYGYSMLYREVWVRIVRYQKF